MQTRTLAIGGGVVVAIAIGAAIYLRPLDSVAPQTAAAPGTEQAGAVALSEAIREDLEDAVTGVGGEEVSAPDIVEQPAVGGDEPEMTQTDVAEAAPEETAPRVAPRHQEFRFEPDGALFVMGTAAPDVPLAMRVNGQEVGRVDVGGDGTFLMTRFLGFSDEPRVMLLVSDPDGEMIVSDRTFVLDANPAPVEIASDVAREAEVAVLDLQPLDQFVVTPLEGDTEAPVSQEQNVPQEESIPQKETGVPEETGLPEETGPPLDDTDQTDEPASAVAVAIPAQTAPEDESAAEAVVQEAPVASTQMAQDLVAPAASDPQAAPSELVETPAAPAILSVGEDGVEVIQPAIEANAAPEVMANVALDTITYDLDGDVILQGRGLGEGFVQVYVDNAPVSRLPVDEDGTWRGDLPDVDTGVYTLRIDEVATDGTVISRIETPFLREDRAEVAEAIAADVANPEFTIATRTVQPGATLWAIAQEQYGDGVLYVNVFEANKDRIRDPDLIYPGQVFVLPESEE